MKQIIATGFVLILSSFILSNYLDISGHLKSKSGKKTTKNILIFVKKKNTIAASTSTDGNGNFKLGFNTNSGDFDVLSFYSVDAKDTILLKRMSHFDSDTPELTFYIP